MRRVGFEAMYIQFYRSGIVRDDGRFSSMTGIDALVGGGEFGRSCDRFDWYFGWEEMMESRGHWAAHNNPWTGSRVVWPTPASGEWMARIWVGRDKGRELVLAENVQER